MQNTNGKPYPLGSHLNTNGCNFAVYSEHASSVMVCLFDEQGTETGRQLLRQRHGNVWHGFIHGITAGQHYNYRLDGPHEPSQGHIFNSCKLIIDPYAKKLSSTLHFNRALLWNNEFGNCDSAAFVPKSIVICNETAFNPALEKYNHPQIDPNQRIIYELHIKGFTQQHPDVDTIKRGKYLGLIEPVVIQHLQQLGITTLQLMPCFSFMDEARLGELGLSNYWGYNPINFFSPDWRYAIEDPVSEFQQMITGLHAAGFEVILDVVYNHSAEGELDDNYCAFKGLDNRVYYQYEKPLHHSQETAQYRNDSGCGNTLNINHPQVTQLVLDSLRYWVNCMGVDGFRFDLAPILGRRGEHFNYQFDREAAIFSAIKYDTILSQKLLIAEPWDIGDNGYQLGNFPTHWFEVNDKFRDGCRAFWRRDPSSISEFTTRLMGSRDCFDKIQRHCSHSVNCITYHDGFTLEDTVSYQHKHNHANGEDNRDGHGHNLSDNYGLEGETSDLSILAVREQQKRNLVFTLLFARGTPHFLAGDELSHTQKGNNNAYCQDNSISWINWSLNERQQVFLDFCRDIISLRKKIGSLNRLDLPDEHYQLSEQHHDLFWLNHEGKPLSEQEWHNPDTHFLALHIIEKQNEEQVNQQTSKYNNRNALLLFNTHSKNITFHLPKNMLNAHYSRLLNTAEPRQPVQKINPQTLVTINLQARSIQVWLGE